MTNNPLHQPALVSTLKDMEAILALFEVDFYIVGAIARDFHLSAKDAAASIRKTDDVDLAIMLDDAGHFNMVKDTFLASGNFTADATEHIKLYYKGALEVDLIPFGKIESANGYVYLQPPNIFTLNMPGFKEICPFVQEVSFGEGLTVKVCSVEGIVILKLIAYNERPSRTKDISDIEHIIGRFSVALCSELESSFSFKKIRFFHSFSNCYLDILLRILLSVSKHIFKNEAIYFSGTRSNKKYQL